MNRTEARQLDCEIRECLENFSIEQGLNPEFGKLIMDNYLENYAKKMWMLNETLK